MSRKPNRSAGRSSHPGLNDRPWDLPGGPWLQGLAATALLYLIVVVFFRDLVFSGLIFAGSGDTIAAVGFERWGRSIVERGILPLWNPLIFSGMPSFGSLQFTPDVYPVGWLRPIYAAIFLGASSQSILAHHLLGGFFCYLLLRDLDLESPVALFGAVVFFFSPQEIVLGPVSHGGKLFTIAWLPLVLLMTRRLLRQPDVRNAGLLALVTGIQLLALHMQIAYYGLLMMGLYFLVDAWQHRRERDPEAHLVRGGLLAASVLLALALSAYLLWPVYEYSRYSIRGGAGTVGGGVSYAYATNWSLHPMEMVTFLIPSWLGYGGSTYWGWMPATDHPYYMGLVPLLLAVVAVVLARRERTVQFFIVLWAFALLVAFGKHLPLLYAPLYKLLPFFAKFRVPAMILILVLLATACLAAIGLRRLLALQGEEREKWAKITFRGGIVFAVLFLLLFIGQSAFEQVYAASATSRLGARYGVAPSATLRLAGEAWDLFLADALRVTGLAALAMGALFLALRKRIAPILATLALLVLVGTDLWVTNARLVETVPPSERSEALAPPPAALFLQQQEGTFRIVDLSGVGPQNRWVLYGIEEVEGYSPAKVRAYQELLERLPQGRVAPPEALAMLNARYIVTAGQVTLPGFVEEFSGDGTWVYRYEGALGPAWLVGETIRATSEQQMLDVLVGGMDPARTAVTIDAIEAVDPAAAAAGSVTLLQRDVHTLRYRVEAPGPVLLVLSEVWYPAG